MGIEEAIEAILKLPQQVGEKGVEIMRSEVPNKTGRLSRTVRYEVMGSSVWIGTTLYYAQYVEYGRGEVRPKKAKALHWVDGGDVFAMRSSKVDPNQFVERTRDRLEGTTFIL